MFMNELVFRNQGPKVSVIEISGFEKKYSIALPADFRDFLLANNGGTPNKAYYVENKADLVVNFFYSLGTQKYSLEEAIADMEYDDPQLLKEMIPIGEDAFGNVLCLSITEKKYGSVFSRDHEDGDVRCISNSLSGILKGLKETL